jgi:hypothetical protein
MPDRDLRRTMASAIGKVQRPLARIHAALQDILTV